MKTETLLEAIFPSGIYCISCNHPIEKGRPYDLCGECYRQFSFATDFTPKKDWYPATWYGLWEKELLYRFKYNGKAYYAKPMGRMMADMLRMHGKTSFDLLVPVPIHKERLKKRGYNQAALLAEALGDELKIPVEAEGLIRVQNTSALKTKGYEERQASMKGAFAAGAKDLAGKRILLVDDILTTGSTAENCTAALIEAGAASVSVTVFSAVRDGGISR